MNDAIQQLDLTGIESSLDRLWGSLEAGAGTDANAILSKGRQIAEQLYRAPRREQAGEEQKAGWHAVISTGEGESEVACWREAGERTIVLSANINSDIVEQVRIGFGDRVWGGSNAGASAAVFSTDSLESGEPGGAGMEELLKKRCDALPRSTRQSDAEAAQETMELLLETGRTAHKLLEGLPPEYRDRFTSTGELLELPHDLETLEYSGDSTVIFDPVAAVRTPVIVESVRVNPRRAALEQPSSVAPVASESSRDRGFLSFLYSLMELILLFGLIALAVWAYLFISGEGRNAAKKATIAPVSGPTERPARDASGLPPPPVFGYDPDLDDPHRRAPINLP